MGGLNDPKPLPDGSQPQNNTFDNVSRKVFHFDRLDRVLERQHITGIAISGYIGVGIFVSSGELIAISGSAGCVIGYLLAGLIATAVMRSLAELVSVRPLSGGLLDYPHTFVDEALGFACGLIYWLGQCISMATMLSSCVGLIGKFQHGAPPAKGTTAAVISGLLVVTIFSNLVGVRTYGQLERVSKWFKLTIIPLLCLLMIVINANVGRTGIGAWNGNYTNYDFPPYLRPGGFANVTTNPPFIPPEPEGTKDGITGFRGQLLGIWTSTTLAIFACMGGDLVIVSAGEAKRPRADLPNAARFMYLVPILFYFFASLLAGLNINYMDPGLYRPWSAEDQGHTYSPFIVIARTTSLSGLPDFLNACFVLSAYTASNTALYVSSRTLFALAQQYGPPLIRNTLGKTNDGHTPVAAIICSSIFGLLAFLGLADTTFNQPLSTLSSFFVGGIACVYASQTIAFLRFKAGLARLRRLDIYSRDHAAYKQRHYRARWQPATAWFGLVGSIMIALLSGWFPIYLLNSRAGLAHADRLKSNSLLAADVVSSFSGPALFLTFYLVYKFARGTRIRRTRELTLDEYILPRSFPGEKEEDEPWETLGPHQGITDLERQRTVSVSLPVEPPPTQVGKLIAVLKEAWSYAK